MLRSILAIAFSSFAIGASASADKAGWVRTEATDAFSGAAYSQFTLSGTYLTPPSRQDSPPELIVKCRAGRHGVGFHVYREGSRLATYLFTNAVMDRTPEGVPVMYRLDDGKPQAELWSISTDGRSAFFPETTLNNLLNVLSV